MKKLLIVSALLLSTVLFGMQQLAMKPMVQVAAIAAMPVIKQAARNYSGNVSAQCAVQPYDYEGIFPYNPVRDNECIRSCIVYTHDKLYSLGQYSYNQKLQNAQSCIEEMQLDPQSDVAVIRTDGKTVGFIWYRNSKSLFSNIGYIAQRGVLEEYRGLGFGNKLINHAEQQLEKDPDVTVIQLKKTVPMDKVYDKMGYQNITLEGAKLFTYQKRLRYFSSSMKQNLKLAAGVMAGFYTEFCLHKKSQSVESNDELIDQQIVEV